MEQMETPALDLCLSTTTGFKEWLKKNTYYDVEIDMREYPIKMKFTRGGEQISMFDQNGEKQYCTIEMTFGIVPKVMVDSNISIPNYELKKLMSKGKEVAEAIKEGFMETSYRLVDIGEVLEQLE